MSYPKGDIKAVLSGRLKPGERVIDVGASNGCVSKVCAQAVGPTGRVYAFEPDPRWWHALGYVVRDFHPIIVPSALVVTSGNGPVTYFQSRHQFQSCLDRENPGLEECSPMQAYAISLDEWFGDELIAAIKLDVQGSEARVLQGADKLLKTCPFWIWECWPAGLKAAGASTVGICELFQRNGYRVEQMNGESVNADAVDQWQGMSHCNLVAVK